MSDRESSCCDLSRKCRQPAWSEGSLPQDGPGPSGLRISGVTHPSSLTSGDYYDYIPMVDGTLAVIVGDVIGHGLGPALEMWRRVPRLRAILSYESNLTTALSR